MKQSSKDPFEVAYEEQQDTHLDSPAADDEMLLDAPLTPIDGEIPTKTHTNTLKPSTSIPFPNSAAAGKSKEDEEEEEEENTDMELGKLQSRDPDKLAKMQAILSQFTDEQMSRYESFRRSAFHKTNIKRLLTSVTANPKISPSTTIVVSGIAKMFVGELIETGRIMMNEREETGAIRPRHIREAYRRLKLEGKVPKKSVSARLFR